jgi:D-beta-D-heptose 7-phosphate kinase/D-beta-D-heptose 1-phosphate adenosyltransferase
MIESKTTQLLKKFKVLLIGDSCIDEYIYGQCHRLSPEAPVPVLNLSKKETKPGMAANVYENLKSFNIDVDFVTNAEIIVKTRYIDEKSGQHLLRVDQEGISTCWNGNLHCNINSYDALVISDYNKGFLTYELIERLIKDFSGPVFIDTKKEELSKFEGAIVKINNLEYSKARSFCSNVIVTLGKDGAKYKEKIFSAPVVEVYDVCGAGDTFLAALSYKYLETTEIEKAINFANKAAAISVQHSGVYVLTEKDIEIL